MTSFDGSTGGTLTSDQLYPGDDTVTAAPAPPPTSTAVLDMLIESTAQEEADGDELFPIELPGDIGVRIMCARNFPFEEWKIWQEKSMPPRKKRPTPMDLNQKTLCMFVLANTAEYLEFHSGDAWHPITGADGRPMEFGGQEMRDRFGVFTAPALIEKLFKNRDGYIIRAGTRVINVAGYGDEESEAEELEALADPLA